MAGSTPAYQDAAFLASGWFNPPSAPTRTLRPPNHREAERLLYPRLISCVVEPVKDDDSRRLESMQFTQPTKSEAAATEPAPQDDELLEQLEALLELRT